MKAVLPTPKTSSPQSDLNDLRFLLAEIRKLIDRIEAKAAQRVRELEPLASEYVASGENLLHYLTLRSLDLNSMQTMLQRLGLSSLGRSEGQVLANLKQVADRLAQCVLPADHSVHSSIVPVDWEGSHRRLRQNSAALFGPTSGHHRPCIMVTAPDEVDSETMVKMVDAGMNCLRVNTAHGSPEKWQNVIECARAAGRKRRKHITVFMDLPGPKIRTGAMQPGPRVVKVSPRRNAFGQTVEPVSLILGSESGASEIGTTDHLRQTAQAGDYLHLIDTRGRLRLMAISDGGQGRLKATCDRTIYIGAETTAVLMRGEQEMARGRVVAPPCVVQKIDLVPGDRLLLTADQRLGQPTSRDSLGTQVEIPRIACTFPEALVEVKVGEAVYFDDGKIRGVVSEKLEADLLINIVSVQGGRGKLGGEKGINFPDSHLTCGALTETDVALLKTVVELSDGVALSFVNRKEDVRQLRAELAKLGRKNFPLILKIETNRAFHNLAELVLEGMREYPFGVMIARGDLAVECGFERLAELQEEIMWVCEAAHVPVIWATQVLESLAKTGFPTRAEISDASLSARAECVMLNKGPFIVEAVSTLGRILEKMQGHQSKKLPLMRALHFGADI